MGCLQGGGRVLKSRTSASARLGLFRLDARRWLPRWRRNGLLPAAMGLLGRSFLARPPFFVVHGRLFLATLLGGFLLPPFLPSLLSSARGRLFLATPFGASGPTGWGPRRTHFPALL